MNKRFDRLYKETFSNERRLAKDLHNIDCNLASNYINKIIKNVEDLDHSGVSGRFKKMLQFIRGKKNNIFILKILQNLNKIFSIKTIDSYQSYLTCLQSKLALLSYRKQFLLYQRSLTKSIKCSEKTKSFLIKSFIFNYFNRKKFTGITFEENTDNIFNSEDFEIDDIKLYFKFLFANQNRVDNNIMFFTRYFKSLNYKDKFTFFDKSIKNNKINYQLASQQLYKLLKNSYQNDLDIKLKSIISQQLNIKNKLNLIGAEYIKYIKEVYQLQISDNSVFNKFLKSDLLWNLRKEMLNIKVSPDCYLYLIKYTKLLGIGDYSLLVKDLELLYQKDLQRFMYDDNEIQYKHANQINNFNNINLENMLNRIDEYTLFNNEIFRDKLCCKWIDVFSGYRGKYKKKSLLLSFQEDMLCKFAGKILNEYVQYCKLLKDFYKYHNIKENLYFILKYTNNILSKKTHLENSDFAHKLVTKIKPLLFEIWNFTCQGIIRKNIELVISSSVDQFNFDRQKLLIKKDFIALNGFDIEEYADKHIVNCFNLFNKYINNQLGQNLEKEFLPLVKEVLYEKLNKDIELLNQAHAEGQIMNSLDNTANLELYLAIERYAQWLDYFKDDFQYFKINVNDIIKSFVGFGIENRWVDKEQSEKKNIDKLEKTNADSNYDDKYVKNIKAYNHQDFEYNRQPTQLKKLLLFDESILNFSLLELNESELHFELNESELHRSILSYRGNRLGINMENRILPQIEESIHYGGDGDSIEAYDDGIDGTDDMAESTKSIQKNLIATYQSEEGINTDSFN